MTTNDEGINYLIGLSKKHSELFLRLSNDRRIERVNHPTEIITELCMDGRANLTKLTRSMIGMLSNYRNAGGKFDLGWAGFQYSMKEHVDYAINKGRRCVNIATYHYSEGDRHRGCRGFEYDTEKALASAIKLTTDFNDANGKSMVYGITWGIETDHESLILHGDNSKIKNLAEAESDSPDYVRDLLKNLYPDMPLPLITDLIPLVQGNIAHTREVQATHKPIADMEHKEWILGVGRGFDWLHEINRALIIGPFDPDIKTVIWVACEILEGNMKSKRINPDHGLVLLSSAPFRRDKGYPDRQYAIKKSQYLGELALDVIKKFDERHKEPGDIPLLPHLRVLKVIVDMDTRKIEELERI